MAMNMDGLRKYYTQIRSFSARTLRQLRRRTRVLDRMVVDGASLQIVDSWYWPNRKFAVRALRTATTIYSSITLSPRQPMTSMRYFQGLTELYKAPGDHSYRRALVLGVAGGSVVHYLLDFFPRCRVDGIELSPQLIEIAKNYFWKDLDLSRLNLVNGDAADFVDKAPAEQQYQGIYCDIFANSMPVTEVYCDEFLAKLQKITAPDGIVIFNLLNCPPRELRRISESVYRDFGYAGLLFRSGRSSVLVTGGGEVVPTLPKLLRASAIVGYSLVMEWGKASSLL